MNTKYKGSVEDPVTLLVRDFDEDGTVDLVEIDSEGGEQYPSRGLSCSSSAMPFVKEEFPTYDSFARASLEDVYGADKLSTALRYEATHLAHTVFINDGTGVFSAHSLPRHSQASVGYGVVVADFDADGGLDIFIANNSFAPQAETGRFDGGLGTLLRGIGDGTFEYVSAAESGISLPDDAKAVAVGDLNADGVPDLVVTTNNGAIKIFQNRGSPSRHLRVRLRGSSGNPDTIGAQVTLITKNDVRLLKDVSAGGGYLSQSSATIVFALPNSDSPKFLVIRWPDGSTSTRKVSSMDEIEIRQPIDPT